MIDIHQELPLEVDIMRPWDHFWVALAALCMCCDQPFLTSFFMVFALWED
jgi:hypothetical protein